MASPVLTVVIPTRDRCDRLAATLAAVDAQRGVAGGCEMVVIDDGSRDGTAELLAAGAGVAVPLRWQTQPPRGPAAARNRGVAMARGERILLLGDDTAPAPGALAAHLAAAGGREVGVQGMVEWDPAAPITPVMRFLAPRGPQFYFAGLVAGGPVPYTAVLGSNFSAPARWLLAEPFDESFPAAAFEDTELAWRWSRRGWRTVFAPAAVCWHHHHYATLEPFLRRQERAGRAARHAVRRHPRMAGKVVVEPLLYTVYALCRYAVRRVAGSSRQEERWDLLCRRAFFEGLLRGGEGRS